MHRCGSSPTCVSAMTSPQRAHTAALAHHLQRAALRHAAALVAALPAQPHDAPAPQDYVNLYRRYLQELQSGAWFECAYSIVSAVGSGAVPGIAGDSRDQGTSTVRHQVGAWKMSCNAAFAKRKRSGQTRVTASQLFRCKMHLQSVFLCFRSFKRIAKNCASFQRVVSDKWFD